MQKPSIGTGAKGTIDTETGKSDNGVVREMRRADMATPLPVREPSGRDGPTLSVLRERREKAFQNLNNLRSDREAMRKQLEQQEEAVNRMEGAILMLDALIGEASPQGQTGG